MKTVKVIITHKLVRTYALIVVLILSPIIFFALGNSMKVRAATVTWDGGAGDDNWSTAANWSSDTLPTSADDVVFNGTSTDDSIVDSGFTGTINSLSINSGYTGTITLSSTLAIAASYSQATGTFNGGSQTLDVNTTFSLTGGTFVAPSTLTVGSTFTISGSPTFTHNSGTVTFDGTASATLTCNSVTFNLVTFAQTSSTKTVGSSCTMPLGSSPTETYTGSISVNGGTLSGTGTLTVKNIIFPSGSTPLSGFTGFSANALTISGGTLDLSSFSPVSVTGSFTISSGTFTAPTGIMTIGVNFTNSGGTFNHNSGTINLGTSNQTIAGSTTFYNLTKNVTADRTLTFTAGTTQTVTHNLDLQGNGGATLTLKSSSAGSQWSIDPQGARAISYLAVQDSNNANSTAIPAGNNVTDSGNNTNWSFTTSPLYVELDRPLDRGFVGNDRPVFRWKEATTSASSAIAAYKLEINNGGIGDFFIDNIPASRSTDFITSKFTIQYENFTDTDANNNYLTAFTKSSSDWNSSENNGVIKEGKRHFTITANDGAVNFKSFGRDFYVDRSAPSVEASLPASTTSTVDKLTLTGKVTDPLKGSPLTASGPKTVKILIEKADSSGKFSTFTQGTVDITDTFFTSNQTKITNNTLSTSDKYAKFTYTSDKILDVGNYKVTVTGLDRVNNAGSLALNISVVGSIVTTVTSKQTQTPSPTITPSLLVLPSSPPSGTPTPAPILTRILDSLPLVSQTETPSQTEAVPATSNVATTVTRTISSIPKNIQVFVDNLLYIWFRPSPTFISNIQTSEISQTTAVITWDTNHYTQSIVEYGEINASQTTTISTDKTKSHRTILVGLKPRTTYRIVVSGEGLTQARSEVILFTTLP